MFVFKYIRRVKVASEILEGVFGWEAINSTLSNMFGIEIHIINHIGEKAFRACISGRSSLTIEWDNEDIFFNFDKRLRGDFNKIFGNKSIVNLFKVHEEPVLKISCKITDFQKIPILALRM